MKPMLSVMPLLFSLMLAAVCFAAPTLTTPATTNVGAGMATLVLQSSGTGTGYFTLLAGSNASCGTGAQVQAGQTSSGAVAPSNGSLPLTANVAGNYTVRNLPQSTAYTVCFTADSPSGVNLNATPVKVNLTTAVATAFTSPSWSLVGNAGFTAYGGAYKPSLAIAPDGSPFVVYQDAGNSDKLTVMKYSGGVWSVVGSAGFTPTVSYDFSLAFAPDGTPHVLYSDADNGQKMTVRKFSGGVWSAVGSAGFSAGTAFNSTLAFAPDSTPYVAYTDSTQSYAATVKKYNGTSWVAAGITSVNGGTRGVELAFALDGTPYLALMDAGNGKITVKKYSNSTWNYVGAGAFSIGTAVNGGLNFTIAPDGTPYVAYADWDNNVIVMNYSAGTGLWSAVGNSAGMITTGTAMGNSEIKIAITPDGTPYVAYGYRNPDSGRRQGTAMKYAGGLWTVAASADITDERQDFLSLAVSSDGTPYVIFSPWQYGTSATVKKLINIPPTISGTPDTIAGVGTAYSFTPSASYANSFSVSGILPPGLSFNATDGSVSGTPTTAGTYGNIVITATNNTGSTSLAAFSLTVEPAGSTYPLTLTIQGTGEGSVLYSSGETCSSTNSGCSHSIYADTVVTLTAVPNGAKGSVFSGWSGCPSVSGSQCSVTMSEAKTLAAYFNLFEGNMVKVDSYYYCGVISNCFGFVVDAGELSLKAGDIYEPLDFNRGVIFKLKGGYSSDFLTVTGTTSVHGSITISAGTVTIDGITIQ